jgi:hypothetical protein
MDKLLLEGRKLIHDVRYHTDCRLIVQQKDAHERFQNFVWTSVLQRRIHMGCFPLQEQGKGRWINW